MRWLLVSNTESCILLICTATGETRVSLSLKHYIIDMGYIFCLRQWLIAPPLKTVVQMVFEYETSLFCLPLLCLFHRLLTTLEVYLQPYNSCNYFIHSCELAPCSKTVTQVSRLYWVWFQVRPFSFTVISVLKLKETLKYITIKRKIDRQGFKLNSL